MSAWLSPACEGSQESFLWHLCSKNSPSRAGCQGPTSPPLPGPLRAFQQDPPTKLLREPLTNYDKLKDPMNRFLGSAASVICVRKSSTSLQRAGKASHLLKRMRSRSPSCDTALRVRCVLSKAHVQRQKLLSRFRWCLVCTTLNPCAVSPGDYRTLDAPTLPPPICPQHLHVTCASKVIASV